MILDMSNWRNNAEQNFWLRHYQAFIQEDPRRIEMDHTYTLKLLRAHIEKAGFKATVTTDHTLLVEMPNTDYMYMFLSMD